MERKFVGGCADSDTLDMPWATPCDLRPTGSRHRVSVKSYAKPAGSRILISALRRLRSLSLSRRRVFSFQRGSLNPTKDPL